MQRAAHFELDVPMKKSDILNALRENKDIHIEKHAEVLEIYKTKAKEALKARLDQIDSESPPNLDFHDLPRPLSFVETYDSVISMIEASQEEVITLTRANYLMFIDDNWDWRGQFDLLNSTYQI